MTLELSILIIEKVLRYGPDIYSDLVLRLGRTPTLDEIKELMITKKPHEYFTGLGGDAQ